MATISQRITLDGAEDIRKKLEELGAAGEKAFKQIQDAAKKPIIDPAQIDKSKQAFDQLAVAAQKTGNAIEQAGKQAETAGASIGTSLGTAARNFTIAATTIAFAISAIVRSLTSGAGETAQTISQQADALGLTIPQWLKLKQSIDAAGGSAEGFTQATLPLIRNLEKLSLETSGKTVQTFADGTKVAVFQMTKMSDETKQMVAGLEKFGVSLEMIQKGDTVAIMQTLAQTISAMPDGAAKAAAGIRFFGASWKQVIADLTAGTSAMNDSVGAMGKMRIASRTMTEEQVKNSKAAADQWDDLGKAIRALKDQIGAVFAPGSAARAEWLTNMVDDARILLTTFLKLDAVGRENFLKNLGDSAGATAFKILIAVGQQLAGVWNVLVATGGRLMKTFDGIAGIFEAITGSQVAAFFITAAIAATGLALALKGIALVLTPLTALISVVFGPFGPLLLAAAVAATLFWDKLKAGAQAVAALIPQELAAIGESIKKLFAGDFSGFWDQFSAAAIAAFQKIAAAAAQTELGKALIQQLDQLKKELPGTITGIGKALLSILPIATMVADGINKVFGTSFTGTGILAIAIIGQMTGALQLLGIAIGIVGTAFGALAAVFGGPVAALIVLLGVIIFELVRKWDELKAHAIDSFTNIGKGIDWLIGKIGQLVSSIAGVAWDIWQATGGAAIDWIGAKLDWLIGKLKEAAAWVAKVFSVGGGGGSGEGAGAGGSPLPGGARGGLIGGRGSGTSDSNLAWLSRGEFVINAAAVKHFGANFFAALNAMQRPPGFALGGPVGMPALAGSGLGGMHPVTIQFPGLAPIGGLRASSDVVEQLQRAAAMAQVRSGGRKPSRYT